MNVNAAGHHVAAAGVNDFAGVFRLNRVGKALDEAIFDQQILLYLPIGIDDEAIFNQYAHRNLNIPPQNAAGERTNNYSVASQLSGMAAYIAAQVTRCDFQVFSFGAWASGYLPGPKPITGMPWRPMMETPLVEKVHLSTTGALPNRPS